VEKKNRGGGPFRGQKAKTTTTTGREKGGGEKKEKDELDGVDSRVG